MIAAHPNPRVPRSPGVRSPGFLVPSAPLPPVTYSSHVLVLSPAIYILHALSSCRVPLGTLYIFFKKRSRHVASSSTSPRPPPFLSQCHNSGSSGGAAENHNTGTPTGPLIWTADGLNYNLCCCNVIAVTIRSRGHSGHRHPARNIKKSLFELSIHNAGVDWNKHIKLRLNGKYTVSLQLKQSYTMIFIPRYSSLRLHRCYGSHHN